MFKRWLINWSTQAFQSTIVAAEAVTAMSRQCLRLLPRGRGLAVGSHCGPKRSFPVTRNRANGRTQNIVGATFVSIGRELAKVSRRVESSCCPPRRTPG